MKNLKNLRNKMEIELDKAIKFGMRYGWFVLIAIFFLLVYFFVRRTR